MIGSPTRCPRCAQTHISCVLMSPCPNCKLVEPIQEGAVKSKAGQTAAPVYADEPVLVPADRADEVGAAVKREPVTVGLISDLPPRVHCWHRRPNVNVSVPPEYSEYCCHCGGTRHAQMERDPDHGSYGDPQYRRARYVYREGVDQLYCRGGKDSGARRE